MSAEPAGGPARARRAERLERLRGLATNTALALAAGVLCGLASGVFLVLLDRATATRLARPWLVYLLPVGGALVAWGYARWGGRAAQGNNLVLDTAHALGEPLPARMAPMVLAGTLATHLFGGSAGREGTAVQMGASLAEQLGRAVRAGPAARRALLTAGVAGGFGSVFGTPVAGAVFALEVQRVGRAEYALLWPALVAALTGDLVTRALGVGHTHYPAPPAVPLGALVLLRFAALGACAGLVARAFIELTHGLKAQLARRVPWAPARAALGGLAVVALWKLVGDDAYLGLGVPTIVRAYTDPTLPAYAFALKLLFTAVTLGAGFLGGEVTPLFFVGAALGNALAGPLALPRALCAAVGMAAVFGAASNAPLALAWMAVELVGGGALPYAALACVTAYVCSGHASIYTAQRLAFWKDSGTPLREELPLSERASARTAEPPRERV